MKTTKQAAQHTTPDWHAREMTSGYWMISENNTGATIATTREGGHARLIASAPDLMEALQGVLNWAGQYEHELDKYECFQRALFAITKATQP